MHLWGSGNKDDEHKLTEVQRMFRLPDECVTGADGEFTILPFASSPEHKPLLCFVNPASGGCLGEDVMRKLQQDVLRPEQVFDLKADKGAHRGLSKYVHNGKFLPVQILACGGDGTAGWVFGELDSMNLENEPPLSVLPLGTGNDLARTLCTGSGWAKGDNLVNFLHKLTRAQQTLLDRWKITVTPDDGSQVKSTIMNNYFSIGVDAEIALTFDGERAKHPEKFKSRFGNKVTYVKITANKTCTKTFPAVNRIVTDFVCDECDKPPRLKPGVGLIITNLPSYAAGVYLWGRHPERKGYNHMDIKDRRLEIVTIDSAAHLGSLHGSATVGHGHAHRCCQAGKVMLKIKEGVAMQIDGEPWMQLSSSKVEISFHKQSPILAMMVPVPLTKDYFKTGGKSPHGTPTGKEGTPTCLGGAAWEV